jgi:hypothetical protein
MKKRVSEEYFKKYTLVTSENLVLSTPTGSKTKGKGKVVEKSP